uniref:Uncharacterized protein n=1 Tax=Oryza glumipatula TaxID=40148 RepID=A0A0E0B864_9ORYZ
MARKTMMVMLGMEMLHGVAHWAWRTLGPLSFAGVREGGAAQSYSCRLKNARRCGAAACHLPMAAVLRHCSHPFLRYL